MMIVQKVNWKRMNGSALKMNVICLRSMSNRSKRVHAFHAMNNELSNDKKIYEMFLMLVYSTVSI